MATTTGAVAAGTAPTRRPAQIEKRWSGDVRARQSERTGVEFSAASTAPRRSTPQAAAAVPAPSPPRSQAESGTTAVVRGLYRRADVGYDERMTRHDKATMSGYVNWPVNHPNFHSTGEGGMWVSAFVLAAPDFNDPFVECAGPEDMIDAMSTEVLVNRDTPVFPQVNDVYAERMAKHNRYGYDELDSELYEAWGEFVDREAFGSPRLLAALVIGTSGGSWWNDVTDDYFTATVADLTPPGKLLVETLEGLYHRPVHLTTHLDT